MTFDWSVGGPAIATAFSALATAAMAVFTALAANRTSAMAKATEREAEAVVSQGESLQQQAQATTHQVELTRETLRTSIEPWLAPSPMQTLYVRHTDLNETKLSAALHLRNVGVGLAVIDVERSHLRGYPDPETPERNEPKNFSRPTLNAPVLEPQGEAQLHFLVDYVRWNTNFDKITGTARGSRTGELWFDVVYTNSRGDEATLLRVWAGENEYGDFHIYRVEYFRPPTASDENLFISVRL